MRHPSRSTIRAAFAAILRRSTTTTLGTMILYDAVQDLYRALYRDPGAFVPQTLNADGRRFYMQAIKDQARRDGTQ